MFILLFEFNLPTGENLSDLPIVRDSFTVRSLYTCLISWIGKVPRRYLFFCRPCEMTLISCLYCGNDERPSLVPAVTVSAIGTAEKSTVLERFSPRKC